MKQLDLTYSIIIVAIIYIAFRTVYGCPFGCEPLFERFTSPMDEFRSRELVTIMAGQDPKQYPGYNLPTYY